MSHVSPIYNNYLDAYKKNCNNKELTGEDKIKYDYKQFEIIDNRDQRLKSPPKKTDEIQKLLWVKTNKNDFDSLMQDVYNNLNNNEFKTTVDKKSYDLKNGKKFLEKITTQKISEKNAKKLYSDLIAPDITKLENTKGKGKNKRNNISDVLKNLETVFTGVYFHYKEENITKKKKQN